MDTYPDQPDPTLYIDRLTAASALHREAAAWSLGEIGSPKAARPLAGLLLRELDTVERTGYLHHCEVVAAVVEAIRRLGATEALYALFKALLVLGRARVVDEDTVVEIVDAIAEVGGPVAVREATDRLVRALREVDRGPAGLRVVGKVLLPRLGLCGDLALKTLRRLARGGPETWRPIAEVAYASTLSSSLSRFL